MTPAMQTKSHENLTESDLPALAREYAPLWLRPGIIVALHGDLGAGKTAFVRAFIREVCSASDMAVPSPTFTLVQEYALPEITIYHYDLYRMADASELMELNWQQACAEGLVFVEWPERAAGNLPPHFNFYITDGDSDNARRITVEFPQ